MITSLVSVIIPTFNRMHFIGATLDSLLSQTHTNWECIVVDDGSTDATAVLLKAYCEKDNRIQYHQRPSERIKGANSCRNYGFELCKGEYIKWMDSDDLLLEDTFEVQVKHLKFNLEIDASIGFAKYFHGTLENCWIARPNKLSSKDIIYDYVINEIYFATAGPLWRISYLEKRERLFNETITRLQDTEFHYRMLLSGLNFKFLEREVLLYRYMANDSITKDSSEKNLQSIFVYWNFVLKTANCVEESNTIKLKIYLTNRISLLFFRILINETSIPKRFNCAIRNRNIILVTFKQKKLGWNTFLKVMLGIVLTILTGKGLRFFRIP